MTSSEVFYFFFLTPAFLASVAVFYEGETSVEPLSMGERVTVGGLRRPVHSFTDV